MTIPKLGTSIISPVTTLTLAPKEDRVAPHFLRVTGKNITPDHPVFILGTTHDWPIESYPNSVLQTLKSCALLLSEFPSNFLGNTQKLTKQYVGRMHLEIQQKYETMDEPWFRDQMKFLGYGSQKQNQCIEKIKKIKKLKLAGWVDQLKSQKNIQAHLDEYGLELPKLHPTIIEIILQTKIDSRNYCLGAEQCILGHFQEQNKLVIELDDDQHHMAVCVEVFIEDIGKFFRDDTIERIEDLCKQLDTGEYSSEEDGNCLHINEAYAQKKIQFNLAEFKMEPEESVSTKIRNTSYYPKFLDGIGQNQSTAIVQGYEHLNGETGTIQFLESQGYTVDLAY